MCCMSFALRAQTKTTSTRWYAQRLFHTMLYLLPVDSLTHSSLYLFNVINWSSISMFVYRIVVYTFQDSTVLYAVMHDLLLSQPSNTTIIMRTNFTNDFSHQFAIFFANDVRIHTGCHCCCSCCFFVVWFHFIKHIIHSLISIATLLPLNCSSNW